MPEFHGVLPALITPFTEDGAAVDADALAAIVERLVGAGAGGLVPGGSTGEFTTLSDPTCALQVWFYVAWRGWPFSAIQARGPRLLCANAAVLGGALLAYAVAHGPGGVPTPTITAAAGVFIAAGLIAGMLFDGRGHAVILAAILLGAAALYLALEAYADGVEWTRATGEDWVAHAGLNAIGVGVILHVAVGRRWPFGQGRPSI